jgi:hypothetical protein
MKKLILVSAIALSGLFYNTANAQMRVSLGLHFGSPRIYVPQRVVVAEPAPVVYNEPVNYDGNEDYYYMPDVDAYYSVTDQCYYYNDGGNWVSAAYLPGAYHDYDWRNVRHFEVRAPRPFMHDDYYRNRFNGVAFNGQWNSGNGRGYNNDNRINHNQFRNNDHRNNEVTRNQYRQDNRDNQRPSPRNFPARDRNSRDDNRHGRS